MKRLALLPALAALSALSAFAACGPSDASKKAADSANAPSPAAEVTPSAPSTPAAPAVFRVRFETSKGPFVVEAHRDWAPIGVDRFYQLVTSGYYDGNRFFRVMPGFIVQFGMHGDPAVGAKWEKLTIQDDPVTHSNARGTVTFAKQNMPNTRSTHIFVNYGDNKFLDEMAFAPFGTVVSGMNVVDKINAQYGESPEQGRISAEGNAYLEKEFPKLDFIRSARVVDAPVAGTAAKGDSVRK